MREAPCRGDIPAGGEEGESSGRVESRKKASLVKKSLKWWKIDLVGSIGWRVCGRVSTSTVSSN